MLPGQSFFTGFSVEVDACLSALFMYSFMTERESGVLRKIRGEMKGGFCLKKPIFFRLLFWWDR